MSGDFHKIGNIKGADGVGVPAGGQRGQILQKVGDTDFATGWGPVNYTDIQGKVPKEDLPDLGIAPLPVKSEAEMLNLPAVVGNMAIRTDLGKTFVLMEEPASTLGNWLELVTTSDVQSVNGQTGNVQLTKADVGLGNVDNTADSDKPEATTSVRGLMPAADKAKLNNATSSATASTVVSRDSSGKSKFKGVTIESAPAANTDATTKAYVDAQVSSVAGGSVLSNTDWDAMRSVASTGVVEGWVKGCPAGGAIDTTYNLSLGFVKDPVWKLESRSEGLGYVTQRAALLNCVPKYMIGFAWERTYNPATAKWGAWVCVAGDSGDLRSVSKAVAEATPEEVLIHRNSPDGKLYNEADPYVTRRVGNIVHLGGAMRGYGSELNSAGRSLGWWVLGADAGAGNPGSDYTVCSMNATYPLSNGVQQGSGNARWYLENSGNNIMARRYEGTVGSSGVWLPFQVSYPAPVINTYTGPS